MIRDIIDNHIRTLLADENLKTLRSKIDSRPLTDTAVMLPEILFITSFPPRECGIATYSQDLIKAMNKMQRKKEVVATVTPSATEVLLIEIRDLLKRG